jgi:hypothetical protein
MPNIAARSTVWSVYGKSIAAGLVAVAAAVQAALSDSASGGRITQIETVQIAIAVVNAALVWLVPNIPAWPWVKTALAAALAVLQLLTSLIVDGVGSADVSALIIAALMVLGPAAAPAGVPSTPIPPARPDPRMPYTPGGEPPADGAIYSRDV